MLLAAVIVAASCAPVDTPPPAVVPQGEDRYLIDPRTGAEATIPAAVSSKFETAWRYVVAGNELEAQRRLADIQKTNPDLLPVMLANAAMHIKAGRFDAASVAVSEALARNPESLAARVYEAEIAYRQGQTRPALALYDAIAARPDAPPTAAERVTQLRETVFNELYAAAQSAPDPEAARLLREALSINAGATEARILLARKLLAQKNYDEARRELDPLLNTIADRAEIQEMLAEIEVGRGRYQEAIVRYDRLARRTKDPRYEQRLEDIKQEWSAANMPAHFRTALDSVALTRAELATLLYWTVPAIRFAQNLGTPPIAVDIEDVEGREEMIRAIALGLYDVDPVTRRVSPFRQVTAGRLSSLLARVLTSRGAACARGLSQDKVLAACGVTDPLATYSADATVTGREARTMLEQVAKRL
ncbi:MAG: tetratricopeptide repeat protein [Thermoanaerobaculia bacterium]